jgi:small subunit ribosomal protein S18
MIFRSKRKKREPVKVDCLFCKKKLAPDYKEIAVLNRFISDRGKILGRSRTGLCQKHQRHLTRAIKRARHLALLPFVVKP